MWKMPCHNMFYYWIFVAKEVVKNLNEVSWNDSGTEVIRPNTEGQDHLELQKVDLMLQPVAKVLETLYRILA